MVCGILGSDDRSFLCCRLNKQCKTKNDAVKEMNVLGVASFALPGDTGFPLNALYMKPANRGEAGKCLGVQ